MIELLIGIIVVVIVLMYGQPFEQQLLGLSSASGRGSRQVLLATSSADPISDAILKGITQAMTPWLTSQLYNTEIELGSPIMFNFEKYQRSAKFGGHDVTYLLSVWGQVTGFKISSLVFQSIGSAVINGQGVYQIQVSIDSMTALYGSVGDFGSKHSWIKLKYDAHNSSCLDPGGYGILTSDVANCKPHSISLNLTAGTASIPQVLIGIINIPWVPSSFICPEIDFNLAYWDTTHAGTILNKGTFSTKITTDNYEHLEIGGVYKGDIGTYASQIQTGIDEQIKDTSTMPGIFSSVGKTIGFMVSKNTSMITSIGPRVVSTATQELVPASEAPNVC